MTYAQAIKKLRTKMILTQLEFAQMLGVSYESVNRWEAGRFKPTTKVKRQIVPLFEKYGITLEE